MRRVHRSILITGFLALVVIAFGSCSLLDDEAGTHCYLYTAFYLIYGDTQMAWGLHLEERDNWPDVGRVQDAFEYYNNDPNYSLVVWEEPTYDELYDYQNDGYLTAVRYRNGKDSDGPIYHIQPLLYKQRVGKKLLHGYAAGYF